MMLDHCKFTVIQFNNGMHGWQYSDADYQKCFPDFLETIRSHEPTAKPLGLSADDLYRLVDSHPEYHGADIVHFNAQRQRRQAAQVAEEIKKLLP